MSNDAFLSARKCKPRASTNRFFPFVYDLFNLPFYILSFHTKIQLKIAYLLWKLSLFRSKKIPKNSIVVACRDLRILKIVCIPLTYYKPKRLLSLFKLNLSLFKCMYLTYNHYHLFTIGVFRFEIIFFCIPCGKSMIFWEIYTRSNLAFSSNWICKNQ